MRLAFRMRRIEAEVYQPAARARRRRTAAAPQRALEDGGDERGRTWPACVAHVRGLQAVEGDHDLQPAQTRPLSGIGRTALVTTWVEIPDRARRQQNLPELRKAHERFTPDDEQVDGVPRLDGCTAGVRSVELTVAKDGLT